MRRGTATVTDQEPGCPGARGSHRTHRWREMDSNFRSREDGSRPPPACQNSTVHARDHMADHVRLSCWHRSNSPERIEREQLPSSTTPIGRPASSSAVIRAVASGCWIAAVSQSGAAKFVQGAAMPLSGTPGVFGGTEFESGFLQRRVRGELGNRPHSGDRHHAVDRQDCPAAR